MRAHLDGSYNRGMRQLPRPMRVIAAVLAFALVHTSFSPEAWSQVVSVGAIGAPVGGSAAAAATNGATMSLTNGPAMTMPAAGLNASFGAPALTPSPALAPSFSAPSFSAPVVPFAAAGTSERAEPSVAQQAAVAALTASPMAAASKSDESKPALTPAVAPANNAEVRVESGPKTRTIAARTSALISGVATLGVAALPLDISHANDLAHGAAATLGYVSITAVPLLAAAPLSRHGAVGAASASRAAGALSALCLAATLAGPSHGLFQRIGLTVGDAWLVAVGVSIATGRLTRKT